MAIAIKAIEPAFRETLNFFSGPGLAHKWLRFGFIIFLFTLLTGEGLTGGGFGIPDTSTFSSLQDSGIGSGGYGNFSAVVQEPSIPNPLTGLASALQPSAFDINTLIPLIIFILIIAIVIGFLLSIVGWAAFFAALESVRSNHVEIGFVRQSLSKGFSIALLGLVLFLLQLPFLTAMLLAIIGFFANFFLSIHGAAEANPFAMLYSYFPFLADQSAVLGLFLIGFVGMAFFFTINYFLKQFGVYLMHSENIGAFTAMVRGIRLGLGNFVELLILVGVQIVLGVAIIIASLLGTIILLIPLIIFVVILFALALLAAATGPVGLILVALVAIIGILFLAYLSSVILSPIYVFIFRYNMNVLDGFLAGQA